MATVGRAEEPEAQLRSTIDHAQARELLRHSDLQIEGLLTAASNTTVRCVLVDADADADADAADDATVRCVYKPMAGERPLWDFAEGTLGRREVATYAISQALGWPLVPPTIWREDGPLGPGMVQLWIKVAEHPPLIDLRSPIDVPADWSAILEGEDAAGAPIVLAHALDPVLQRIALFDAIVNNADRKGGHVLRDAEGRIWGIDHGVTLAAEDKLRTVLWGWAGEPIPGDLLADVAAFGATLADSVPPEVSTALDGDELAALRARVTSLVADGIMPLPGERWPVVPWPVF